MSTVVDRMTPGFADPVHDAQRTFRLVLDAMARPGSIRRLPDDVVAALVPPPSTDASRPLDPATTAVLLALLDADTSVDLVGRLRTDDTLGYFRFHTGVRPLATIDAAAFTVVRAADVDAALWTRLYLGTDEAPQGGVTLVIEVDGFGRNAAPLVLRGPGIESTTAVGVAGCDPAFWTWRAGLQSRLPRGIDLILTCATDIVAIPRSTRIALES